MLGYFKENSHELTNIKFCPVQPEIINDIASGIINKEYCFVVNRRDAILKASSLLDYSTIKKRNNMLAGHNKE